MKKLLLSMMCLGVCAGAFAADDQAVTLSGGWGWNLKLKGSNTITLTQQYAEINFGIDAPAQTNNINTYDYKAIKVELEEALESGLQFKVSNEKDLGWPWITSAETTLDLLETDESGNLKYPANEDGTLSIVMQSNAESGNVVVKIKSIKYVKTDGTEVDVYYGPGSWGASAEAYSGLVTFTSQWGEIAQLSNVSLADYRGYKVELNEPVADGTTINVTAVYNKGEKNEDGTTKDYYISKQLTGDVTSVTVDFQEAVDAGVTSIDKVSVQSPTAGYSCDIKSVTLLGRGGATAIADIESAAEVVSTTYYSLTGVASQTPMKGVNIVKQVLSDGSVKMSKIVTK